MKLSTDNTNDSSTKYTYTIDFLVPYGSHGGIESVLNDTALSLLQQNIRVRVIQLSKASNRWVHPDIEFYTISQSAPFNDVTEYIPLCKQYLISLGAPDIIIATPFPMLTMFIKLALLETNMTSKIISWLHAPIKAYDDNAAGGPECLNYADLVLVLSRSNYHIIHSFNPDINIRLVKNPIDIDSLHFYSHYNTKSRNLYYIGRLSQEKNVSLIINAISNTTDKWELTIIGDGNERNSLENLTKELHLTDRIHFIGWQTRPWDYVQSPAALVLSSDYEGFPLVCNEALASGIPVISTKVDGVVDIICNGANGYLYDSQNELTDILNYMALHSIPDFNPTECRNAILPYNKPDVLNDITNTILSII